MGDAQAVVHGKIWDLAAWPPVTDGFIQWIRFKKHLGSQIGSPILNFTPKVSYY